MAQALLHLGLDRVVVRRAAVIAIHRYVLKARIGLQQLRGRHRLAADGARRRNLSVKRIRYLRRQRCGIGEPLRQLRGS